MALSRASFISSFAPVPSSIKRTYSPFTSTYRPFRIRIKLQASLREAASSQVAQPPDIKRFLPGSRFNQIVVHNGIVYLSGQVARGTDGSVAAQTRQILAKIDALLEQVGTQKSHLLTANIWMSDISKIDEMNAVWIEWVDKQNMPVRACVQSALVDDSITVEIQATAALPSPAKIINTPNAAAAVGPYNQAIVVEDGTVYISGCIGLMPGSASMAGETIQQQTQQALHNLKAIVEASGATVANIVKTTLLLNDMNDFAAVNSIYSDFFEGGRVPARSCFAAKQLPKSALVEIEAIAKL